MRENKPGGKAAHTIRILWWTAFLVGIALGAGPACATSRGPSSQPDLSIEAISFNIRYGTAQDGPDHWDRRRDLVTALLDKYRPDVVGLQEALRFQIDAVRRELGHLNEIGIGRDGGSEGEYSAILYRHDRFDVVESGTFWLSETPEVPSTSWGNSLNRICTWARLKEKRTGRTFYVFNTHFDHRSENSRTRSARLVASRIATRSHSRDPFLLMGDFNARPDSLAIRSLTRAPVPDAPETGLDPVVDTYRVLNPDAVDVGTFNGFEGITTGPKIDFIFVDPSTRVLEASIVRDSWEGRYPSDHFPVRARLQF